MVSLFVAVFHNCFLVRLPVVLLEGIARPVKGITAMGNWSSRAATHATPPVIPIALRFRIRTTCSSYLDACVTYIGKDELCQLIK